MASSETSTINRPVMDAIRQRYSPYNFEPERVSRDDITTCFEAARWAASSYNEQPWSYIIAYREDAAAFETMLSCLVEANREWAQHAGAVVMSVVARKMRRNGKPNRSAEHDMGFAAACFNLQAVSFGLQVHHMEGINLAKTRATFRLPHDHDPFTAFAIGYASDHAVAENADRPRLRRLVDDFVLDGQKAV